MLWYIVFPLSCSCLSFPVFYLFIWLHLGLSCGHMGSCLCCGMQNLELWRVESSSLSGDWTQAPCIGSSVLATGLLGKSLSVQFSSVTQSCPTLCDPMNCGTPGLPVHHQLLEFTQTYVHWVGDAIQPSHPLSSPSPPALNLSQDQGLFKWVSSSHPVAKAL